MAEYTMGVAPRSQAWKGVFSTLGGLTAIAALVLSVLTVMGVLVPHGLAKVSTKPTTTLQAPADLPPMAQRQSRTVGVVMLPSISPSPKDPDDEDAHLTIDLERGRTPKSSGVQENPPPGTPRPSPTPGRPFPFPNNRVSPTPSPGNDDTPPNGPLPAPPRVNETPGLGRRSNVLTSGISPSPTSFSPLSLSTYPSEKDAIKRDSWDSREDNFVAAGKSFVNQIGKSSKRTSTTTADDAEETQSYDSDDVNESDDTSTSHVKADDSDDDGLPPGYRSNSERSPKLPSVFKVLVHMLVYINPRALGASMTLPPTTPLTIPHMVPTQVPRDALPDPINIGNFFKKPKEIVAPILPAAKSIAGEVEEKGKEAATKAKDVAEKVLPHITIEFKGLAEQLGQGFMNFKEETAPKVREFHRAVKSGDVTSDASYRHLDGLPGILFTKWRWRILCLFILFGSGFGLFAGATLIYILAKANIFKYMGTINDLMTRMDDVEKLKDYIDGELGEIQDKIEKNLKEFWNGKIIDNILETADKIQNWIISAIFAPLKQIPGVGNIAMKAEPFFKKGKGGKDDKRGLYLIDAPGETDHVITTEAPTDEDWLSTMEEKSLSTAVWTYLQGREYVPADEPTTTITDIPTSTSAPMEMIALGNDLSSSASDDVASISCGSPTSNFSTDAAFNISTNSTGIHSTALTSMPVTAAASRLSVFPLLALLVRGLNSHRNPAPRSHPPAQRASNDPWQAYHQIRSMALHLCLTVEGHTDELSKHTQKKLSCGASFEETYPPIDPHDRCEAQPLYQQLLSTAAEFCEGSRNLATAQCLVLQVRDVQTRDQFCALAERFANGEPGYDVEECESGDEEMDKTRSWDLTPTQTPVEATETAVDPAEPTSTQDVESSPTTEAQDSTSASDASPETTIRTSTPTAGSSPDSTASVSSAVGSTSVAAPATNVITYTTQATFNSALVRTASTDGGTPPAWTGSQLSRTWAYESQVFPIPTGYIPPNIVPADPQVGDLTYFNPGGGACGGNPPQADNEMSVAIAWQVFDLGKKLANTSFVDSYKGTKAHNGTVTDGTSMLCNRFIQVWMGEPAIVNQTFMVRDRCTGCRPEDVDIQPGVFLRYWATNNTGRISVTWKWLPEEPTEAV